jgi:hypothetical protein
MYCQLILARSQLSLEGLTVHKLIVPVDEETRLFDQCIRTSIDVCVIATLLSLCLSSHMSECCSLLIIKSAF